MLFYTGYLLHRCVACCLRFCGLLIYGSASYTFTQAGGFIRAHFDALRTTSRHTLLVLKYSVLRFLAMSATAVPVGLLPWFYRGLLLFSAATAIIVQLLRTLLRAR